VREEDVSEISSKNWPRRRRKAGSAETNQSDNRIS
jgi:hypothetical protein